MAKYKQDVGAGLRALAGWARNPVSEDGAAQVFKGLFALGGPLVARMVAEMGSDPDGRRLLSERPDLGAALDDRDALGAMPPGSLGRVYHDFMSGPEVVPGYFIAGLMYRDGRFDRLDWDDDMKYLIERLGNTHDLTHVLSGYGTDLAAEAININFSLGITGVPVPLGGSVFAVGTGLALVPRVGPRRWYELSIEAFRRGRTAARHKPFHCVSFEELLPEPLDAVRERLGIPPLRAPFDSSDWLLSPIARRMANGYGQAGKTARKARAVRQAVEAGVPVKQLMQVPADVRERLLELAEAGASGDELLAAAGRQ